MAFHVVAAAGSLCRRPRCEQSSAPGVSQLVCATFSLAPEPPEACSSLFTTAGLPAKPRPAWHSMSKH